MLPCTRYAAIHSAYASPPCLCQWLRKTECLWRAFFWDIADSDLHRLSRNSRDMVPEQLQPKSHNSSTSIITCLCIVCIYIYGPPTYFAKHNYSNTNHPHNPWILGSSNILVLYGMFIKYNVVLSACVCRWDEWVPECRVLKHNEQNLTKQQDLKRQYDRYGSFVFLTYRLYSV